MIQKTTSVKGPPTFEEWEHFSNFSNLPILLSFKSGILSDRLYSDVFDEHPSTTSESIYIPTHTGTHVIDLDVNRIKIISAHDCLIQVYNPDGELIGTSSNRNIEFNNLPYGQYSIYIHNDSSTSSINFTIYRTKIYKTYIKTYNFRLSGQTRIDLIPSDFIGSLSILQNDTIINSIVGNSAGQMITLNHNFGYDYANYTIKISSIDYDKINEFDLMMYSDNDIITSENMLTMNNDVDTECQLAHIHCQKCSFWWFQNKHWLQNFIKTNNLQCPECNDYNINSVWLDLNARPVPENPESLYDDFYRILKTVYDQYDTENPFEEIPIKAFFTSDKKGGMAPLTIQFENESHEIFDTFLWDFGDPDSGIDNISTLENPSHTFNGVGDFDISLTASNSNGDEIDVLLIYDYISISETIAPPIAEIYATPISGIKPLVIKVGSNSTGAIDTWEWDFGDGRISTSENPPNIIYNFSGDYIISLTVTGPGGSDTTSITISVNPIPAPIADFNILGDSSGLQPLTVNFSDNSEGQIEEWHWIFGDGKNSDEINPTNIYEDVGIYNVSLTVIGPGGSNTITKNNIIEVSSL